MGIQTRVLGRTGVPVTVLGYGAMVIAGTALPDHLSANLAIAERGPLPPGLCEQARRLLPAAAARPAEGAGRPEDPED